MSTQADPFATAFAVLGLPVGATRNEVRQTYRDLAQVWHPDRFSNNERLKAKTEEKMREINTAYELLEHFYSRGAASATKGPGPSDSSSSQQTTNTVTSHHRSILATLKLWDWIGSIPHKGIIIACIAFLLFLNMPERKPTVEQSSLDALQGDWIGPGAGPENTIVWKFRGSKQWWFAFDKKGDPVWSNERDIIGVERRPDGHILLTTTTISQLEKKVYTFRSSVTVTDDWMEDRVIVDSRSPEVVASGHIYKLRRMR
jgi:hypothetical protein